MITILPAIDLKGGQCVRLRQGRADEVTAYSDDPVRMALHWQEEGGRYLHVVDLDGAFQGHPVHLEALRAIAAALAIPVEFGGGLRQDADIEAVLEAGASRAILGTRVCEHPEEAERLVARFGRDRLAVGIDARDGLVQTRGWVETTEMRADDLARRMDQAGVGTLIYTDTSRDGMLCGVNLKALGEVCAAAACDVIASGGVSTLDDIRSLQTLRRPNLVGAIVGKALYEGTMTLNELMNV